MIKGKIGKEEFEIVKLIKTLSSRGDGWALEANLVSWSGQPPKLDIRSWSPTHEKCERGLSLTKEESEKLLEIIENLPTNFPTAPEDIPGDLRLHRLEHLGRLSRNAGGWYKEVNITSWSGAQPKVDVRFWSPSHIRFGPGATLTREQATSLIGIDIEDAFKGVRS